MAVHLHCNAVDHAAGGLHNARGGIALGRQKRQPFDDDAPEPIQIDQVVKFPAVAEGAGSGHYGVLQPNSTDVNRHIWFCRHK